MALLAASICLGSLGACRTPEQAERAFPYELVEGDRMYTVLPPDAIGALDEPTFATAAEAEAWMAPDEPVMGLVGRDGSARAYSAWQLEEHEIVNDEVDGELLAVTW